MKFFGKKYTIAPIFLEQMLSLVSTDCNSTGLKVVRQPVT